MRINRKCVALIITTLIISISLIGCGMIKNAKYYYKKGMKEYKEENYNAAKKNFKLAITKNKNKAEYVIDYAFTLIQTNNYEEAIKQFDKVIIDKDNKIVRENNKEAYRGIGIAYYEASDYDNAIKAFDSALIIKESKSLDLDILYYKGKCETELGRYKEAVNTYTTLLNKDNKDVANYLARAFSYSRLEQYEKASEDYNKAIKLAPKNYDIYFQKYSMFLEADDKEAAEDVLKKALEIKVKGDKDYFNIGRIYYYQGDYDKAMTELKSALEKGNSSANFYLGEILTNQRDYKKAIPYYEDYINNHKNIKSGTVYNQLGVCYLKVGEYKKALEMIQTGIDKKDFNNMKSLKFNEIIAYERLINFDKALDKTKSYLEAYPEDELAKKELEFIKTRVK